MGKILCAVCKKRCRGTVLKIDNHYIHNLCFKCHQCEKPLNEADFQFRDGVLYCPEDYRRVYSIKCTTCGNPVEGNVVTALGSTFHTFCLRCFSCNRIISSGEKTIALNDRFYCEKCAPPQILQEDTSLGVEAVSTPRDTSPERSSLKVKKKTKKIVPRSPSLPQRFSEIFRSKKSRSQTFQSAATLPNGTDALTINVDSTNREIEKKFNANQSPNYSFYSGEDVATVNKEQNMQLQRQRQQQQQQREVDAVAVVVAEEEQLQQPIPTESDAAPTTPSMLNTLSGDTSTLLFDSVRRICPPGVDYGHQYPISYLRLAEQGYTAVTSSDLLSSAITTPGSVRHPISPINSSNRTATQRLSRRDIPPSHTYQSRTIPITSVNPITCQSRFAPQSFGDIDGARPLKDRYSRYRHLSPGSASGGSMSRAVSSGRSNTFTPNFLASKSQTYSSYSTPNVNSRRGIRVLAESMMRSPTRIGRSMSPEAALSAQAEARRLAAYPGAKIPDADSEPAIDRYDWPAPPSPAVVMIDRRREKALKNATLRDNQTPTKSEESSSDTRTLSPGARHSPSPGKESISTAVGDKINALKRATGNSGMSAAVAQYVEEEEKRKRDSSPDLDPISASRSPNASFEPPYGTRYSNHRFASPRPGYTSGILTTRPVSLPRGVNVNSTTLPAWSPSQRRIYTSTASKTLPVNGAPGPLNDSRDGTFSLTTSGLSMDGVEARAPVNRGGNQRARSTTLIGGLPPPSISGLRPVGRRSYHYLGSAATAAAAAAAYDLPRGRAPTCNTNGAWRGPRTASENNRSLRETNGKHLLDDEFPDVQSWLRPIKSQPSQAPQKVYSYDQLKVSSNTKLNGVDEGRREEYLSGEEFERLFQMTRMAFQRLPEWRQNDLKRRLDLY